jgi:general secretion pathway protein C
MSAVSEVAARLAVPARWLVVAGIAYTLATSVLYFLSPPVTTPTGITPVQRSAPERPAPDINVVASRNLFGSAEASPQQAPADTPTVQTRLPLELLAVFVADQGDQSAAIISQRGRPGLLYGVGDDLPGNATLVEVHDDHVVLRRAGVRESLRFPELSEILAARARTPASDTPDEQMGEPMDDQMVQDFESAYEQPEELVDTGEGPESMEEFVEEYRDQIDEDPAGALEQLGVEPVAEGAAEGYRVGDLAQSPYLSQTGLQPGDVILSVNGRPVGDLDQDRLELDNVLAQGSARLEVQRGTRRFFVTATLQ